MASTQMPATILNRSRLISLTVFSILVSIESLVRVSSTMKKEVFKIQIKF